MTPAIVPRLDYSFLDLVFYFVLCPTVSPALGCFPLRHMVFIGAAAGLRRSGLSSRFYSSVSTNHVFIETVFRLAI